MKTVKLTVMAGLCAGTMKGATLASVADLEFVVGSGANLATLIIDFNDSTGEESFAWGYRWDGLASGAQMLVDIAAADPRLDIVASGTPASGFFFNEVTYTANGVTHSAASDFTNTPNQSWGYYLAGGTAGDDVMGAGGTPTPVSGGGSTLPDSWTRALVGAAEESFGESGRLLSDGAWDAWSFGALDASFTHQVAPGPESPTVAVPEPSGALLSVLGLFAVLRRRRQ